MHAMVLAARGARLTPLERPDPIPGPGQVRVKISACGVCRTDLHVVDGELPDIPYPIIPGHEVVGRVEALGAGVTGLKMGMRVGVPWLGFTCGECFYCQADKENLCDRPQFTGYTRDGGFASHLVADARYCLPLGEEGDDVALAPLLCAGLIGWRSLVMAGEGNAIGIYGFGAAGHIVAQLARAQGRRDLCLHPARRQRRPAARNLAGGRLGRRLGRLPARGTGCRDHLCPRRVAGAAGSSRRTQRRARCLRRHTHVGYPCLSLQHPVGRTTGGLCRQSYPQGWRRLLQGRRHVNIQTHTTVFPLEQANEALSCLREGRIVGAAVLRP